MSARQARALMIVGAVGVGKTTVAGAVAAELESRGTPGAMIDLDALRGAWPAPPDDRFQHRLELANLRDVSRNHRAIGAEVLVAAGVLEERAARAEYEDVFGVPVSVVRLLAPRDLVRARLRRRHELDPEGLAWHLDRYDELTAILDAAAVEDLAVPIAEDPRVTARAVLAALGI